jgi:hypothetical protein
MSTKTSPWEGMLSGGSLPDERHKHSMSALPEQVGAQEDVDKLEKTTQWGAS